MKKLSVVCLLVLGLMVSPCFAIEYCKDFLEPGNLGGLSESLKTWDEEWSLNVGEEVELDIWLNDVPQELLTAGFWVTYDPSLVSIEDVLAYDNADLPGPWVPSTTGKFQDPDGPGTYFFMLGRLTGVVPDTDGDIPLGRVRFRSEAEGDVTITVSVDPAPSFEMVVGSLDGHGYDEEISPNTLTLYQTTCAVDVDCDDHNLCTADTCNPSTGACLFDPIVDCDDSNLCTTDFCDPNSGECVFDPKECNDWDACTSDSCNPGTGECVHDPIDCNFGYSTDFLEPGNPGGWTSSLKTFEDEWTLSLYEEIEIDIWLNDVPETMSFGGFWIEYNPSLVSIIDVKAYDGDLDGTEGVPSLCCPGLSGPWDPGFTEQISNPNGPGTYFLSLGQHACIAHDSGGDIILGRVKVRCESPSDVYFSLQPIPSVDTAIGCDGPCYDSQITSHNVILHQVNNLGHQAIPTLSEWGLILFMTIIMGLGVVTLFRRRRIE